MFLSEDENGACFFFISFFFFQPYELFRSLAFKILCYEFAKLKPKTQNHIIDNLLNLHYLQLFIGNN